MVNAELDAADPSKIALTTAWKHAERVKTIPGARWDKNSQIWRIPVSWPGCLALRTTFGDELEIGPNLMEWASAFKAEHVDPAMELRDQLSAELYPDLYPHQNADVLFLTTAEQAILGNEPGTGKAQPISEPVLTDTGFRPIGEISPGDAVYAADGSVTTVLAVHPQGLRSIFRVTFSDGTSTRADREHLWAVRTANDRNREAQRVMTTQELAARLRTGQDRIYLVDHDAVRHPHADLPINPYVLGCLLGDGSLSGAGARLTSFDAELVEWVRELAEKDGFKVTTEKTINNFGIVGVRPHLNALGLKGVRAHEKFIPHQYRFGSIEQRRALLAGLLDTDGSVEKSAAEFVSVSQRLANDVADLARSLGLWASVSKPSKKTYTYKDEIKIGRPAYRVRIAVRITDPCPFLLTRKVDQWVGRRRGGSPIRRIVSVVTEPDEQAVCIEIDHPQHLYLTRHYIPTHNTASSIRSMLKLFERGENPFPALVVTPNSMKTTWANEFKRWWPGVNVAVLKGTATQRRKTLAAKDIHVVVLNWEALRTHSRIAPFGSYGLRRCKACGGEEDITEARCQVHKRELNEIPFKTVIADEIHRAKDASTQQTRALWAATGDAHYRWGLTGTPVANSPQDLWSLLHWVDPAGYPQKTKFTERFLDIYLNGFGGIDVLGIKATAQKEFFGGFDPRFRRMTKKAVLPFLPEIVRERRWVEMNPKQAKAYKQMQNLMLAELDSGELLVAPNVLTRTGRLLQFASAFGELTPPDLEGKQKLILTEPSSKIAAFMDDLEDFGNESIAVFGQSRQLINLLDARLTKAGVEFGRITGAEDEDERQEAMDRFQSGASKLILCTIAAGGVGITLTAASTAVFLQRSWSRVDMEQAINRVHRIGSEVHDHITIIDYITPDTLELAVLESLDTKGIRFEEVVRDAALMRKILKEGHIT